MCDTTISRRSVKKYGVLALVLTIFWHLTAWSEVLSDPTRPPGLKTGGLAGGTKSAPRWVLSSTLIAPARRLATINGKTVTVGEQVGGARVMTIEPARVSLREGDKDYVVQLTLQDFKQMH